MSFEKLLTNWDLLEYLKEKKFSSPTEIQVKAIPLLLKRKSLVAAAQTGTGKTLAYALPLVDLVKRQEERHGINMQKGAPTAIVLVPTRELARQVEGVFKEISHFAKCRVRLYVSGESVQKNTSSIKAPVDILITVPGKLATAIKKKELYVDFCQCLVIDEADQVIDQSFAKELQAIQKELPVETQRVLFSATVPDNFDEMKQTIFADHPFESLILKGTHKVRENIETYNIFLGYTEKPQFAVEFLKKHKGGQGIIFVNQKEDSIALFEHLQKEFPNRKLALLHGGMTPRERKISYKKFSEDSALLICTDIAARGLDVEGLAWVLNYDLPFDAIYYIHRVGRTGRRGAPGQAFNFVTAKDDKLISKINQAILQQDTLKIKPLEMLKKPKKVVEAKKKLQTAKQIVKREEEKLKQKRGPTKTTKWSPRFARKKKK